MKFVCWNADFRWCSSYCHSLIKMCFKASRFNLESTAISCLTLNVCLVPLIHADSKELSAPALHVQVQPRWGECPLWLDSEWTQEWHHRCEGWTAGCWCWRITAHRYEVSDTWCQKLSRDEDVWHRDVSSLKVLWADPAWRSPVR